MKLAVIYARYSPRPVKKRRDGKELTVVKCMSNATQIEKAKAACMAQGFNVYAIYQDEALSGKNIHKRPGFQEALATAKKVKATLVVYSLSRMARNTKDAIEIAEQLDKAGANLMSLTERIDTTTAMGRAFFKFIAVLAELERELTSERVQDAMLHRQKNGERMSDREPFGWRRQEGNGALLEEDPIEQRIIKRIVRAKQRGKGLRAIGRQLARRGLTCRGGKWHHSTIKHVLERAGVV